jgi:hypothetical protein
MSAYNVKRAVVAAAPGAAAPIVVVPGVVGKSIVVHAFWLVVSASGTHARFQSDSTEIFGGGSATQGIPLGANGGISIGNAGETPTDFWFQTAVSAALILKVEAACEVCVGVIYEER